LVWEPWIGAHITLRRTCSARLRQHPTLPRQSENPGGKLAENLKNGVRQGLVTQPRRTVGTLWQTRHTRQAI